MCIPCGKTFSSVPMPISSVEVKVKYKGHIFKKKNYYCRGILVSQTYVVQFLVL